MRRREPDKSKDKDGAVAHTVKAKNEFQGPSSNMTRIRTFRENPKVIRHALRIKMLKTFISPPLVLAPGADLFCVRALLNESAKDKFILELTETDEIRIYPNDSCAYFDIANALMEQDFPLRGLKLSHENVFKVMCIGFHKNEDLSSIQAELGTLGHDVLRVSKPLDTSEYPPKLPIYSITLKRAENNWEIFNITKLLGMRVVIRPPPKIMPLPTCSNCHQRGHLEYECGRRLCQSCSCSFIKGENVIAKLAYEWPMTVKKRMKGAEERRKPTKRRIKRPSLPSREQQHRDKQDENANETQEENKADSVYRIKEWSEFPFMPMGMKDKSNELQDKSDEKWCAPVREKRKESSPRKIRERAQDDAAANETDADDFDLLGSPQSDSSLVSLSSETTTYSSHTGDSVIFDDSSIPSETELAQGDVKSWKKMLDNWLVDIRAEEDPAVDSWESSALPKVSRKKYRKSFAKYKYSYSNVEMVSCTFAPNPAPPPEENEGKEGANPLGRRRAIGKKQVHHYSTTIGCGTARRVKIVNERSRQENEARAPSAWEEGQREEEFEESEVLSMMLDEDNNSRQGSPEREFEVDEYDRGNEVGDEVEEELEDDGRLAEWRFYTKYERLLGGEVARRFFQEHVAYEIPAAPIGQEGQEEPPIMYVPQEPERVLHEDVQHREPYGQDEIEEFDEENQRQVNWLGDSEEEEQEDNARAVQEPVQQVLGEPRVRLEDESRAVLYPNRRRRQLPDPGNAAQPLGSAASAPDPSSPPQRPCPVLYNRRYPYRYEEFVNTYMDPNSNNDIPYEEGSAWLEMIYHEIESLLNYVDRIGRVESYRILMNKMQERFSQKFGPSA